MLLLFMSFAVRVQGQTKIDSLQQSIKHINDKNERLKILDKLTRQMIRKNHQDLIPTLRKYMSQAKELGEYDLLASKSRFLIQQYIMKGKNKEGLQLCDSILSFKPYFKKKNSEAHIILKRGGIYYSEFNYDKAIEDYQTSAKLFLEGKDSIFAADAYYFAGQAYSNSGKFIPAIQKYEIATDLYERLKDYSYMFNVATEVNLLYRRNGLQTIADKKTQELFSKVRKYKMYSVLEFLFLQKAEKSIKDKNYDVALQSLDSSKKYSVYVKDVMRNSVAGFQHKQLLLRLHVERGNIIEADKNYKQILELEKTFKNKKVLSTLYIDKARYFIKKNSYNKALLLLNKFQEYSKNKSQQNMSLLSSEKMMSEVYEELNNPKKALFHKKNYIKLKDSINKESLVNAFAFHQTRFDTAQKEKELILQEAEIKQLEADKQLSKSKRNTLLAILTSVILIAFGIWWKGKNKRIQLKKELERNKTELTDYTNQLLSKSKEQEELISQLEELKEKITEEETIGSIEELINSKILTKDDWYLFKDKFTKVYPRFFNHIKNKGYSLTKSEERLVALEKLKLDNNEIANMLGVSVDSIFISRYRLRKKINAPKEISLIEFLS